MMNILPLSVYSHNSFSIFCHKFPFYNNCSCGWNCCSLCTGYWLALIMRAVLSSVRPNRQFILISIGCQAIWGYQWNLLFDPLTQARSHSQVGWLSLRLLIRSHLFPPFPLFVPITSLPVSGPTASLPFSVPTVREKDYYLLLVQDVLPSCIFLTEQICCSPTSTWGKQTTNIFGWQTDGICSQTPLGWSVGHPCVDRSIFDLSNGFVSLLSWWVEGSIVLLIALYSLLIPRSCMTWQWLGPLQGCGSVRPYRLVKNKPGSLQFSSEDPYLKAQAPSTCLMIQA